MSSLTAFSSVCPSLSTKRWGCDITRNTARSSISQPVRNAPINMSVAGKKVLVVGGTRFAGLYLVHALHAAGVSEVTLLNRGSKAPNDPKLAVPGESTEDFLSRVGKTRQLIADRTDADALTSAVAAEEFDIIYDNNGRELSDSAALIDIAEKTSAHYVYMSSAGVYKKSFVMPHIEGDEVDLNCRHKGKLNVEQYLRTKDVKWTAFRPTYIYGAGNYNPIETYFFERVVAGRPVCIPGHGMHLTGLGHVRDLSAAMAACGDEEKCYGQIYNVQDEVAISFDGVAKLCGEVAGVDVELVHYDPKDMDFGGLKAFPFRPQHFFTSPAKALRELDFEIQFDLQRGFRDAYENDFLVKKNAGTLKDDFRTDDIVLAKVKGQAAAV